MLLSSMMSFLEMPLYLKIIVWISLTWLFLVVINTINGLDKYLRGKAALFKREEEKTKQVTYTKMVISTIDALVLIEKLIDIEINNMMEIRLLGGTPFNMLQMDHDIDEVSQKIYQGFHSEYFTKLSKDILVMNYWHNYIVDQTTVKMMRGYQRVNAELISRQPVNHA